MLLGIDASRAAVEQRTGTEAYAFFLIRALIKKTSGLNLRVRLYFNQPPETDLFPSLPHVEQRIIPFPRLWTHVRLAVELQLHPVNVFFTPAHVIPFTHFGPSVATVHDLGFHYFPDAHTWKQRAYLKLSTRTNSRKSRRIIADSQATKDDLMRFYGCKAEKIDVIYPGLDPSLRPVTNQGILNQIQKRYAISSPYLLYLGTLQPRKNLVRLVRAYGESGLAHQLVLAGRVGWRSASIMDEIGQLDSKIRQRVHLPGYIAEQDKAALLSGATAVLYPSLYEGFGFPLLEAQACGTPVLAANSSSIPEIAGNTAVLVDPLDQEAILHGMIALVHNAGLRRELAARGLQNIQRFSWERAADEILAVLLEAAGK